EQPERRRRVGCGVLEGRRADLSLSRRWSQHEDSSAAPRHARGAHELRRWRSSARTVLRRAQHRHRFEGQPLHDGDLRREARAEVLLQGTQGCFEEGTGDGVASMNKRTKTTLEILVVAGMMVAAPPEPPPLDFVPAVSAQTSAPSGEWRTYGGSLS